MNIKHMIQKMFHKNDDGLMHWEMLRIVLGCIFFWAFIDKTFGLGIPTLYEESWLAGVSPTYGYLAMATKGGYFHSVFRAMAGHPLVDWLFMLGLAGVGASLLTGMGTRIAGYSGALMMLLFWISMLPIEHNPVFDEHIVYGIVLLAFTRVRVGEWYGLRKWWSKTQVVKRYPILE